MKPRRLEHDYVSDIDHMLTQYDNQLAKKTASVRHEIAKHERIQRLRDAIQHSDETRKIWENF